MDESGPNSFRSVDSHLDALIGKSKAPSIQYLALDARKILHRYEGGLADIRSHVRMNPTTTLMAYSMSKTITAAAVLQLVEAHQIRLDDPMTRYLGTTPYGPEVTIRQLLSHTSGIPNPIPLRWVHPIAQHTMFDEHEALWTVIRKHCRLSSKPGTRFRYSNIGYWLLGETVESVAGRNLPLM